MIDEYELIPYEPSNLPSGPWLVFAPHPDDEVIGMGGTIALGVKQGIRVEVVIVTDGSVGGESRKRKNEALDAGNILGVSKYHFFDIPDRQIEVSTIPCNGLESIMSTLSPQTIFLPGIQEFHPDHRACTFQVLKFFEHSDYQGKIWLYEISRQNEANRLVDVTVAIEQKKQAIQCFESQLVQNDYLSIALSLDKSRSYTLPADVRFAEGFWEGEPRGENQATIGQLRGLKQYYMQGRTMSDLLVSVVVRTKNRPDLLADALQSIAMQSYRPIEIVVVNDAGVAVSMNNMRTSFPDISFRYAEHERTLGRAEAANTGIREARGEYILFLDDDDLFYPECVQTLVDNASEKCFSYGRGKCIRYDAEKAADDTNAVILGQPVKVGRLVLENCIPFNTVCFHREMLKSVGPLDNGLEIFEDWDLMIRVFRDFQSNFVNKIVSEYRIFDDATITGKGGSEKHLYYRRMILERYLSLVGAEDILGFNQSSIDKVVLEKEKTISKLRDELSKLRDELSELERIKTIVDTEYRNAESYVKDLLVETDRLRAEIENRDNNISGLENSIKVLQSSISWRITKPLRAVNILLRK